MSFKWICHWKPGSRHFNFEMNQQPCGKWPAQVKQRQKEEFCQPFSCPNYCTWSSTLQLLQYYVKCFQAIFQFYIWWSIQILTFSQDTVALCWSPNLRVRTLMCFKIRTCFRNTKPELRHELIHSFAPRHGSAVETYVSRRAHLLRPIYWDGENWRKLWWLNIYMGASID